MKKKQSLKNKHVSKHKSSKLRSHKNIASSRLKSTEMDGSWQVITLLFLVLVIPFLMILLDKNFQFISSYR